MGECLSELEIVSLASDEPLERDRSIAESHLKECDKCRERLERARERHLLHPPDSATQLMPSRPASPAPEPMLTLDGYEMMARIRGGGQGVVFKAIQKSTSRLVAVKVLPHEETASDRQKQRFEREVSLAASLRHPNIVTIYDSGLTSGRYFFAMEYIHGQPLDDAARALDRDGKLSLFAKVCDAIAHAHQQNVVHRDLKPANVLVDARGEPHVLDFGLAKSAGSTLLAGAEQQHPVTLTSQFMGTVTYTSPEQTLGDPMLVDRRSDVYSLGVMLFEVLTGALPYSMPADPLGAFAAVRHAPPRRPSKMAGGIDRDLDTIILRALSKDPARRYQSAEGLATDIHRYLAGEPIAARRDSAMYVAGIKTRAALRRHPALTALAIIVAATLVADQSAHLFNAVWSAPARWYEYLASGPPSRMAPDPNALRDVRIIKITQETKDRIRELAASLGVTGVSDEWFTARALHDVLNRKLAEANARVIVWDVGFRVPRPDVDAIFAAGVRALRSMSPPIPVIIALFDWIADQRDLPQNIIPAFREAGALWGGITVSANDEHSMPKVDLLVENPGHAAIPGIALAAYAAWLHPELPAPTVTLKRLSNDALLQYLAGSTVDRVALSNLSHPEQNTPEDVKADADMGIQPDTMIGSCAVRLPTEAAYDAVTKSYEDILRIDPNDPNHAKEWEALKQWVSGHVVLIGDFTEEPITIQDGRTVYGPQIHAAAIDALIRQVVWGRYPSPPVYLVVLALAALLGLVLIRWTRRRLIRYAALVFVICWIIGLCVVSNRAVGYVCQPVGPILALLLAFLGWLWFDAVYSHHSRTEAPGSAGSHSHWRSAYDRPRAPAS